MRRLNVLFILFLVCCSLGLPFFTQAAPVSTRVYVPFIAATKDSLMGNFSIISPTATANKVINPSGEKTTTGYTAVGGSIARSSVQVRRGAYSIAVTPTSGTTDGAYYGTVDTINGESDTFSVDIWAAVGVTLKIYVADTSGTPVSTPTTFTGIGAWQRIENIYVESSTTTRRLYVTKDSHASTAIFYVDGLQFEALAYATTYCDGDQQDCVWSQAPHASSSSRSSQVRSGGRLITLESMNAHLVSQQGTGMPEIGNAFTPYALIDGAFYQRKNVRARTFTIVMSVSGDGVSDWHENRALLIDLIKPDLVYPTQPFVLVYTGATSQLRISCYYDGGFEMTDGTRDIESIAIRCLSVDPYWRTDGNDGQVLATQISVTNANAIVVRNPQGVWGALGTGVSGGSVFAIAQGLDGIYYVGGSFTSAGGVANTKFIAKYDPVTEDWFAMGSGAGGTGDEVNDIQIAPNGDVWIIGSFTNMGGVSGADDVARWDVVAGTWNTVGSGTSGYIVGSMGFGLQSCFGSDGSFYMPGSTNSPKRWDGSTWTSIGTIAGGGSNISRACALGSNGEIYVSHGGTTIGGVASPAHVSRWNPSTDIWTAV